MMVLATPESGREPRQGDGRRRALTAESVRRPPEASAARHMHGLRFCRNHEHLI
jgi:hypothetical protein